MGPMKSKQGSVKNRATPDATAVSRECVTVSSRGCMPGVLDRSGDDGQSATGSGHRQEIQPVC